jgi:hypothetical protein
MLTISEARYQAIRQAVRRRRTEALAAEIDATTDWSDLPRHDLDDFLTFLDTFAEQPDDPAQRSANRP